MKIDVSENINNDVSKMPFELVERKGVGHPDTICDAISEVTSQKYSKYCYENFGRIPHHWFDKVMLIGGEADIDYGKGEIIKPYQIVFAGKVTNYVGNIEIPVSKILYEGVNEVLSNVLTGFVPRKHAVVINMLVDSQGSGRKTSRYRPNSVEELSQINNAQLKSNDSNLLSGYAPLSSLEILVLSVESFVNGKDFKKKNYDTGWDVKLFGSRRKDMVSLLVNVPFLAKHITSMEQYRKREKEICNDILNFIDTNNLVHPKLSLNAQDGGGLPYLTALGTVADTGDVGVTGRGNRINGLITPMRSMSIEAPAGKNPLDHTGKLYGILANRLANKIYEYIGKPVQTHIFTSKESSLKDPDNVIVEINDWTYNFVEAKYINKIVINEFNNVGKITKELLLNGITLW